MCGQNRVNYARQISSLSSFLSTSQCRTSVEVFGEELAVVGYALPLS
jgi:hypothetical protein